MKLFFPLIWLNKVAREQGMGLWDKTSDEFTNCIIEEKKGIINLLSISRNEGKWIKFNILGKPDDKLGFYATRKRIPSYYKSFKD